ncbi:MAG: hypothetical protein PWP27_191 [Clostridiales bacterium]|nr:hypothetical protein [Clostridiales bacterium]
MAKQKKKILKTDDKQKVVQKSAYQLLKCQSLSVKWNIQ